jgi:RimJ/RimL family protein N-acetyltransferase
VHELEHQKKELPDEIIGERVVLRLWRESDAEAFHAEVDRSRDHLARWLPWPDYYHSVADARPFVRRSSAQWLLCEEFHFGVFTREGQLLGSVGIRSRNWRVPSFEIGYWLGQSHEGKGYASEAIRCDAANERSAAVARRCGYVFEGTIRNDAMLGTRLIRDPLGFSMIPEDYQRRKSQWETLGSSDSAGSGSR